MDKLISELLPDTSDYTDLAPDQKQLLKDEILAGGTDDKTPMVATRLVDRLTERFG